MDPVDDANAVLTFAGPADADSFCVEMALDTIGGMFVRVASLNAVEEG